MSWFQGRKVTVMGLGLFGGGRGVTEFLSSHGADVTVTDLRSPAELEPALRELGDLPVRWVLGEHREEDFLGADLVIPNPAVPRDAPLLHACRQHAVPMDTEMNLFFKYCPGKICAVTGSNGKSTTTHLLGAMASRRWPRVRVGGNIGRSLLPQVEEIGDGEWVVLEISSFQLEDLRALDRRPEISVVTNLSPNHLDRHRTYTAYVRAKRTILDPGPAPGVAVINGDEPMTRHWATDCRRRVVYFGRGSSVLPAAPGVWLDEAQDAVVDHRGKTPHLVFHGQDLRLLGRFNLLNATAAAAAALEMGIPGSTIRHSVRKVRGLEHRLEFVGRLHDVDYINDSISTTAESTIAALAALGGNTVLVCGGASKGTGFQTLAAAIAHHAVSVIVFGATAREIAKAVLASRRPPPVHRAASLDEAVDIAQRIARPGSRVLFSPTCPSYDQFLNFAERGRRFKELVREKLGRS